MDAIEASEETREFVKGLDFAAFKADRRTLKAVLANFSIIGEATAHIPDERLASHPEVPWNLVRATRNFIAHVYFGVDLNIIWNAIHVDLIPLETALRAMLEAKDD